MSRPKPHWVIENVPLAPMTTLQLGGPARYYTEVGDESATLRAMEWAREQGLRTFVLGAGSNLVVDDGGFDGLVIHCRLRGLKIRSLGGGVTQLTVGAGEEWDGLVETCVRRGLAGVECMSGIPGLAGATPIQNVGAYGQEVSSVIENVRLLDRQALTWSQFSAEQCEFGYRSSRFKREPDRWLVSEVTFRLTEDGPPILRYRELSNAVAELAQPSLNDVRNTVLRLRASKSMLANPDDPNGRSAGSFFTNPIIPDAEATRVAQQCADEGIIADPSEMPRYPATEGHAKLAAAWLIERAGISKGYRRGAVGVSSRHTLALVHHGGGTTTALLELAAEIRDRVYDRFGVTLVPEPVMLGASLPPTP